MSGVKGRRVAPPKSAAGFSLYSSDSEQDASARDVAGNKTTLCY